MQRIPTNGAIRHTAVIPTAGDLITSDIAMALSHANRRMQKTVKWSLALPSSYWPIPNAQEQGARLGRHAARERSAVKTWQA
jgi:hypothetical protein